MRRRSFLKLSLGAAGAAMAGPACFGGDEKAPETVIVVGAGMAGLAAAQELLGPGFRVTVLEGRDRVGGRLFTASDFAGFPVDLGGSWIRTTDDRMVDLLSRFDMQVIADDWKEAGALQAKNGAWTAVTDSFVTRYQNSVTGVLNPRGNITSGTKQTIGDAANKAKLDRDTTRWLDAYIIRQTGSSPDEVALYDYSVELRDQPGASLLVPGAQRLAERMAEGLDVRTSQVVKSVTETVDGVAVRTEAGETFVAHYVVVAVPLGVLKAADTAASITFDPPLPDAKAEAIAAVGYAVNDRLLLRFAQPFWGDGEWTFLNFLADAKESVTTVINVSRGQPAGALAAGLVVSIELAGPYGRAVAPQPDDAATLDGIVAEVTSRFRQLYGASAVDAAIPGRQAIPPYLLQSWTHDPFSVGAYSTPTPGSRRLRSTLGDPEGPVFFAGEHIGGNVSGAYQSGTISAAIASGYAAAAAIRTAVERRGA